MGENELLKTIVVETEDVQGGEKNINYQKEDEDATIC